MLDTELVPVTMADDFSYLNTETCNMCVGVPGSGRGEIPGLPCLNCDGVGYLYIGNEGLLGLYGKMTE